MRLITIRFAFGSAILLLVDILWVASSEITEYLYHDKNFNKPFFTAYAKSVMFVVYLLGFIFCDSWWLAMKAPSSTSSNRIPDYYSSISDSDQQNLTLEDDDDDEDEDEEEEEEDEEQADELIESGQANNLTSDPNGDGNDGSENVSINVNKSTKANSPFLSDSIWVPMKHCSDTSSLSGKSSETEDDESISFEGDVTIETAPIPSEHNLPGLHHREHSSSTSSTNSTSSMSNDEHHKVSLLNVNFKKKVKKQKQKKTKSRKDYSKFADEINAKLSKGKNGRNVRFSKLIEVRQLSDKHAEDAFLSRLSYGAFMRLLYNRNQQGLGGKGRGTSNGSNRSPNFSNADLIYKGPKLNVKETAMLAFYFTSIWFAANLSFHVGLRYSEAGMVNILSSTTPLFALLLGIIFPSGSSTDAISLTKLLAVLVCISSVAVLSTTEPIDHHHSSSSDQTPATKSNDQLNPLPPLLSTSHLIPLGSIWTLCGAFFYAVYIVLMRYNVAHDSMLNFPMFFGFIGLFSTILMWPIILLLHVSQLELFEWPTKEQWLLILVNGLCGTVISELLWLFGSFMTSSLVGTIAVSFTIPLAVFFDVYFKEVEYPRLFFLGALPMFFSFVAIIVVSQYDNWDPILAMLDRCVKCIQFIPSSSVSSSSSSSLSNSNNSRNTPSSSISTPTVTTTTTSSNSIHPGQTSSETETQSSSQSHFDHDDDETVSNINGNNVMIDTKLSQSQNNHQQSNFFHRFLPSSSTLSQSSNSQSIIESSSSSTNSSSSISNSINNRRFDKSHHHHRNKADHLIGTGSSLLSSSTLLSTTAARLYNFDQDNDDDQEQSQSLIEAEHRDNAYA